MLNPALGGQPGSCNSLQESKKRLMAKPRNLNRRDDELEVSSLNTGTLGELQVKSKSKLRKIFRAKSYIWVFIILLLVFGLAHCCFFTSKRELVDLQIDDYPIGSSRRMTEIDNIENTQLSNLATNSDSGPSQMDLIFRSRF